MALASPIMRPEFSDSYVHHFQNALPRHTVSAIFLPVSLALDHGMMNLLYTTAGIVYLKAQCQRQMPIG